MKTYDIKKILEQEQDVTVDIYLHANSSEVAAQERAEKVIQNIGFKKTEYTVEYVEFEGHQWISVKATTIGESNNLKVDAFFKRKGGKL